MKLPDIHEINPDIILPLNKVGFTGIKMPIGYVTLKNKPVMIAPIFDVMIDLPSDKKGVHSSRNYEVITEVLSKYVSKTYMLENVCAAISKKLLEKHKYTKHSEVRARGEVIFEKRTPKTKILSYESFIIYAKAIGQRKKNGDIDVKRAIGITVSGITACPCAGEVVKKIYLEENKKNRLVDGRIKKILNETPFATHMQRAYGTINTEIPEGLTFDASRLVQIIQDSMSAPTYELLKRPDEAEIVIQAASNPKFVEDCVRYMVSNFVKNFPELPDNIKVIFKAKSLESVHKHNILAVEFTTLGRARKALGFKKGI
jgi:GTP cyclohydrolase-4